jgi:GNAT superfamily N-acetyltransferase
MDINIRIAAPADSAVISDYNALMAKETEGIELDRERLRKGVEALFTDMSKGVYYLAEIDGSVVGQLMITYEWSDWRNATFWWIQSVYVLPEYRNQGIFRALYRYIESLARKHGNICGLRLYVDDANKIAQKTYEALGMKQSHYKMMEVDFTV